MDDKKQDKLKRNAEPEDQPIDFRSEDEEVPLDEATKDSREVLDQLEEPGGLEVEDMPESNELQERRRKTKNRLNELASVRETGESNGEERPFEEESGLFDLVREANLSTRHLKFCCGGILVLLLLLGVYFGGKSLWNAWQDAAVEDGGEESPTDESSDENENDDEDPSILSGILVGEDEADEDDALEAGQNLGEQSSSEADALTQSIVDFASIYEAMQVNVNEFLVQSNERRETLEDYQNQLHYLLYLGEQNVEKLQEESQSLVTRFEAREEEKADSEERYFSELRDLDAYAAAAALEAFTEDAEEIVSLRAQYNARQKLLSYYEDVLASMELRIRDIALNEEALIKGVQVVDIQGSDLDLIIDENEL